MFDQPGAQHFTSHWRWPPRRRRARDPLAQFYSSGTILAHYSTSSALRDGDGNITVFKNLGGAGVPLDAPVVGIIPSAGNRAQIRPNNYLQIPLRLELIGTRTFVLAAIRGGAEQQSIMSRATSGDLTHVFIPSGGRNQMRFARNTGSGFVSATVTLPGALSQNLHLFEIASTATTYAIAIDGVASGSITHPHASLGVSRIGANEFATAGSSIDLVAVIPVALDRPDSAAAIVAARARLMAMRDTA